MSIDRYEDLLGDEVLSGYASKLAIDKHTLDDDIQSQPALFYEVSERATIAGSLRDEVKKRLDEVYAEVTLGIREAAAEDKRKLTEDMVKQETMLKDAYKEAYRELLRAKKYTDLWTSMKDSYAQRGYMLRDLAALFGAQYWSGTAVVGNVDAKEVVQEGRRVKVNEERKRLRRRRGSGEE